MDEKTSSPDADPTAGGRLSEAAAKEAAARAGLLSLPDVTELDEGAARELCYHPGTLSLGGLRALSIPVAHSLGHHCDWLLLDGVESLDLVTAKRLMRHRGGLSLGGLASLHPKVAAALADTTGDLRLSGLRTIDSDVAAALAPLRGMLVLDCLTEADPEALAALAHHQGDLSLGGLESLDIEQAEAIATHRGRLWLDGLRELSLPVAAILGRHDGGLSLAGLADVDTVDPEAIALLAASDRDRLEVTSHRHDNACETLRFVSAVGDPEPLGVAIIGGGFAGIAMAIRLLEAGRRDIAILEKASGFGGTWRDNTYPGCACDIPSQLYSYSFAPDMDWSRTYAPQPEILAYIEGVAARHDIQRFTRFGTTVEQIVWDETKNHWLLTACDGRRFTARAVVSAVGGIHIPHVPDLPGLEEFAGPAFHTARWQHEENLTGRRVAVIGTGASAIQVVPEIAGEVERLMVFQRTAPWVLPRGDRATSRLGRWLDRHVPGMRAIRRQWLYWAAEARAIPFTMLPRLVVHPQRKVKTFMSQSIKEYRLQLKLEPTYALGCKRVLKSDDYYPTLARDNVEVVAEPIHRIGRWDITTADGIVRPVDTIVLATGFKPFDLTDAVDVIGRGGLSLADGWKDGPQAYHGVAVAGFPNLFLLMGPNTALGHNSILVMIEAQVNYILQCLAWVDRGDVPTVEVTPEAQAAFNDALHDRFEKTVWRSGTLVGTGGSIVPPCGSWYRHSSGRNHVLWPGTSASYLSAVRKADIAAFRPAADAATEIHAPPRRRAA